MANGSPSTVKRTPARSAPAAGTVARRVRGFFSWWLKELADSLPPGVRRALVASAPDTELLLSDSRVALRQRQGQAWRTLVDEALPALSAHFAHGVAGQIRRVGLDSAQVVVRLDREQFLRRTIELPAAAAENLAEVIGFEIDRYTPFRAADVYIDFRVTGADPRTKRMSVDIAVVRREAADRALAFTRALGLEPIQLGLADDGAAEAQSFDVMPTRAGGPRRPIRRVLVAGLAILFVCLAAAALYLPVRQKQEFLAEREARLAQVRADAQRAKDVGAQVDDMLRYTKLVYDRKQGRPTATELLDEVTEILSDDTWIQRFHLDGDALTLSGYSAKPSSLIALLEDSAMLSGVQFTGAVRPDPRIGLDAFNLKATVARRGE